MNSKVELLIDNISKVIFGKRKEITNVLICLLSKGHILLEDVPGVGKTTLIHSLAKSIDCSFNRVQFTPDLLPSDIIGVSVYNPKESEFKFNKGPIFTNVLLADEINRTSPKTQSSLLESMQERQVTIDGKTYILDEPFIVLATENPIEYEGTFPLPEAQLDRFMMKITIGYPDKYSEKQILKDFSGRTPLDDLKAVINTQELLLMQEEADKVFVSEEIEDMIISISHNSRNHKDIKLGVSPRGSLFLYRASKSLAYIKGRNYVIPDDIKDIYLQVLAHRIILKPESKLNEVDASIVLKDILSKIKI